MNEFLASIGSKEEVKKEQKGLFVTYRDELLREAVELLPDDKRLTFKDFEKLFLNIKEKSKKEKEAILAGWADRALSGAQSESLKQSRVIWGSVGKRVEGILDELKRKHGELTDRAKRDGLPGPELQDIGIDSYDSKEKLLTHFSLDSTYETESMKNK